MLQSLWGHESFRPLQLDVIESVVAGKDTLALLPTEEENRFVSKSQESC